MTFDREKIGAAIAADLPRLPGVPAGGALAERLTDYIDELHRWNKVYNLTAVRNPAEMVSKHVFDSLTVLPLIHGKTILDVGSGAGLPGIPLALCLPECRFVLLDSNGKKIRFIEHALAVLGLTNVEAKQSRVEEFVHERGFDTVVCRAYTSLAGFVHSGGNLLADGGRLIAMKGKYPQTELDELPAGWHATQIEQVSVPDLAAERHIVVIETN